MPLDHRRNNGPENAFSWKLLTASYLNALQTELKRTDRRNDETRKIFLESGVLSKARGSAYIEMGNTKVMVGVHDPREIPKNNKFKEQGDIFCDFKFLPFSCSSRRRPPMPDDEEKALSLAMKRALQPVVCRYTFPNFQVDVFANVIENDGSALAAAIIAAGLALADAGISTYDVITAATVAVSGDEFFLDPSATEEEYCASVGSGSHGVLTLARLSSLEQVSEMYLSGFMSPETVKKACELTIGAASEVVPLVKQVLVKKVKSDVEEMKKREKEKAEVVFVGDQMITE